MSKPQKCKTCLEELLLTEITTDTGKKIWAYMCGCDELVRDVMLRLSKTPVSQAFAQLREEFGDDFDKVDVEKLAEETRGD